MKILRMFLFLFVGMVSVALAQPPSIADSSPPFTMPELTAPVFPDRVVDIRSHEAVGDGLTLSTEAFSQAIAACADAGGGTVLVPPGIWLTGAIHLKSNINLHIQKGAEIRFSTNPEDYLPPVFVRWAGFECYNYSPLIYARDCTNIAITGEGQLNGQGPYWWHWVEHQDRVAHQLYDMVLQKVPVEERVFGNLENPLRPQFIEPINCKNVLVEGITILPGPFWTVQAVYCENLIVRGVSVINDGPNNDGINVDSCRNVLIEDCFLWTGDDCVAIKSGLNEDGWRVGRPSENVIVRNCRMDRGHGGVVIGSEMSGGVRNILVHDCEFTGTEIGIRIKSTRGRGGVVEDVWFKDIKMGRIKGDAIRIRTDYRAWFGSDTGEPPLFRNIHVSNVSCDHADYAIRILGLPEKLVEGVTLENLSIHSEEGMVCRNAKEIHLTSFSILPEKGPVLHFEGVHGAEIQGLVSGGTAETLLEVQGDQSREIRIRDCDLSKFSQPILNGDGMVQVE